MAYPQLITLGLFALNIGSGIAKGGAETVAALVNAGVMGGLLYWGGFFAPLFH